MLKVFVCIILFVFLISCGHYGLKIETGLIRRWKKDCCLFLHNLDQTGHPDVLIWDIGGPGSSVCSPLESVLSVGGTAIKCFKRHNKPVHSGQSAYVLKS